MNKATQNKPLGKFPVWLVVFITLLLFFVLSSFGISAYQKKQDVKNISVNQGQSEILKQQILQQKDVIDTNWLHTLNPIVKQVRGRLLWSSNKQQGVMEFNKLPKLSRNQQFRLWIYDLSSRSDKPISALIENSVRFTNKAKNILIPFTADANVGFPFKFELTLEEKGSNISLPLLLAQP